MLAASIATYPNGRRDGPPRVPDASAGNSILFGLAPDGVYQANRVTSIAGALLPHRFTLTTHHATSRTTVRRSILCCTVPSLTAGRRYRPSCPTEPGLSSSDSKKISSDRPAHSQPAPNMIDANIQDKVRTRTIFPTCQDLRHREISPIGTS